MFATQGVHFVQVIRPTVTCGRMQGRCLHTTRRMERYRKRRMRELHASNNVGGLLVGFVTFVGGTGSAVAMAYMEPEVTF